MTNQNDVAQELRRGLCAVEKAKRFGAFLILASGLAAVIFVLYLVHNASPIAASGLAGICGALVLDAILLISRRQTAAQLETYTNELAYALPKSIEAAILVAVRNADPSVRAAIRRALVKH